ncbi:retrovirus-related pol polyprotein from transposon TNT 1-94 [Tanacetum coccineum]
MCKTAKEVWHTLIITHEGNSQVENCKIDLLTQEYEKFSISNKDTIDSGFTIFNAIVTSLKSLDPDYSRKNHAIGNHMVYEMILENDGVVSKTTTKKKIKSLDHKSKVTREQTSDDSDSQGESDEEVDEEEAEAFNLLARNFREFFRKGNRFGQGNRFGNGENRFGKGRGNSFGKKGGESSKPKGACYNCGIEGHFASECKKPKENKAFVGGAWSDSKDGDEHQNDATCLMAIDSQEVVSKPSSSNNDLNIIDLQKENGELLRFNRDFTKTFEKLLNEKCFLENENSKLSSKIDDLEIDVKKLANNKEVIEPCKTCDVLTKEADSLKCNVSKLQDEALNFSKFKKSSIVLDYMLSHQKLSQDKEGLGFFKNDKTSSIVNSGCTKYMTRNRRLFTSHKAYDGGHVIFGSNLKDKVIGKGQLCDDDYVVSFTKVHCDISKNGKLLVLNKETMRIEESLNVTFDKSLPEPKPSPSVEDDRINEPIVQDLNGFSSLQVNVSGVG